MLNPINNKVIKTKIKVSFQIMARLAPFNMMALMMIMNHLAGMMLLMTCKGNGMLEIGKMNPDNRITGNINPNNEIIIAVCCESAKVEINIPNAKAQTMNKTLSKASKNKLPSIGIPKTKNPKSKITVALIMDKKMYGNTFPMIT